MSKRTAEEAATLQILWSEGGTRMQTNLHVYRLWGRVHLHALRGLGGVQQSADACHSAGLGEALVLGR